MPTEAGNTKTPKSAEPIWQGYRTGGVDRAGREIEKLYALDDAYVIYFSDCELFYETIPGLVKDLGPTNAALARINRLLPDNPKNKGTDTYRNKFSTLELVADACEMVFCGEMADGLEILKGIQDKLLTTEEGKRRLMYQLASVSITVLLWILYLWVRSWSCFATAWGPWMLAAVLAAAGGVFSVCLNVDKLDVSVNQEKGFLLAAGATRSLVALLAGIALLLAMRSKMFAGIAYEGKPPSVFEALTIAEMFFCFLAGFSESFVPNILRDSDKKSSDGNPSASGRPGQKPDTSRPEPEAVGASAADGSGPEAAGNKKTAEPEASEAETKHVGASPEKPKEPGK
jgi:hypothetical protein